MKVQIIASRQLFARRALPSSHLMVGSSNLVHPNSRQRWQAPITPNRKHSDLHITSTKFDEPVGCNLVARADVVVAMHGRADGVDAETIWLGGQDADLLVKFEGYLRDAGFLSLITSGALGGLSKYNICNRGARGAGAQLELPRTLRDDLASDSQRMASFAEPIRVAIEKHLHSLAE